MRDSKQDRLEEIRVEMKQLDPINVLISLHRGYGLGDAVQMSAVLKHVAKYRPHWKVDYQAEEGRHQVGRGIVANTFAYGQKYPSPHYDAEVQILLYDTWANWGDRPNTRVSSCLHERFDLSWDQECGSYSVKVSDGAAESANILIYGMKTNYRKVRIERPLRNHKVVAIHYQGDSSREKKNLSNMQVEAICHFVEHLGCEPIILDWRNQSMLKQRRITTPSLWGRDAEMVCAVISQCHAFVGIDSGPGKCASATNTPSLIVWTGHHPAPFHDPCPNTTHLVPAGYHGLEPVCNNKGVIDWFEKHYNVRQYRSDPVTAIEAWLGGVLR